jgi:hypothetical protein
VSKNPTSFRLSTLAQDQLEKLVKATGKNRVEIVELALDRLHQSQIGRNAMSKIRLVVDVPTSGWVSENIAQHGSGQIVMGNARCEVELDGPDGKRYSVQLMRSGPGIGGSKKMFDTKDGYVIVENVLRLEYDEESEQWYPAEYAGKKVEIELV